MSTAVYLSNEYIQIAVGDAGKKRVSLKELYRVKIPEGSILNGVIISEQGLSRAMADIWGTYHLPKKNIRLIVDSNQFFTREVTFPRLSEKQTRKLLHEEFDELENQEEYLFDYRVMKNTGDTKRTHALCTAARKEFIQSYVDFFKEQGIELESLDISLNGQLKIYEKIDAVGGRTFISLMLDGSNLISTLMVNGQFKYFNRTRLFSEHGTADLGTEVARTVSSIMQFHAAEKSEFAIENVFMGGFSEEDYDFCERSISSLGLKAGTASNPQEVQMPPAGAVCLEDGVAQGDAVLGDYIYVTGALVSQKRDINFIRQFERNQGRKPAGIPWKAVLPSAVLLVVLGTVTGVLFYLNASQEKELKKLEDYSKDETNLASYLRAQELELLIQQKTQEVETAQKAKQVVDSYPHASTAIENAVKLCAGDKVNITVDRYNAATGVYEFTAMAPVVTDIYEFINQLESTGIFADLEYSGYNYTEKTLQYDIHVSGYLSESAGK